MRERDKWTDRQTETLERLIESGYSLNYSNIIT